MDYRRLGSSELCVSRLGLGTMTFGSARGGALGSVDAAQASKLLDMCIDAGVNLVDTADVYGKGDCETVLGEALGPRRNKLILASKVGGRMGSGPFDMGSSKRHILASCEASLKRLRTDHLDLYQLHKWDGSTPVEETLAALDRLVHDGKVRYIGCSNYSCWHTMKTLCIAKKLQYPVLVSQQIHYSVESRDAEFELVPMGMDQGVGILVWAPLAGGLLTGKFKRGMSGPEGSRHFALQWHEPPIYNQDRLFDIVEALQAVADQRACTVAQLAIAWLLHQPGISSVLFGARTAQQLSDNLVAAQIELTPEELEAIDLASRPQLPYPYWHQALTHSSRLSAADLSLLSKYQTQAE